MGGEIRLSQRWAHPDVLIWMLTVALPCAASEVWLQWISSPKHISSDPYAVHPMRCPNLNSYESKQVKWNCYPSSVSMGFLQPETLIWWALRWQVFCSPDCKGYPFSYSSDVRVVLCDFFRETWASLFSPTWATNNRPKQSRWGLVYVFTECGQLKGSPRTKAPTSAIVSCSGRGEVHATGLLHPFRFHEEDSVTGCHLLRAACR